MCQPLRPLARPPWACRSGIRAPAGSSMLTPRARRGAPPSGAQRGLVRGLSKKPSTPARLPPALPAPGLLASSFPPLFQGAAEGGAGGATSLVPRLIWAALEGHSRGCGECHIPAMVTVPAGLAGTTVPSQAQRGLETLSPPLHPLPSHCGSIAPHQRAWQHPLSPSQGLHLQGRCFMSPTRSPPHST